MAHGCRSSLTRLYYHVKPFVPRTLRWALRRYRATKIRQRHATVWPINEEAGKTPDGWPGWPDGKRFALVLTHDVESRHGLDKVQALAELEIKHGFRSSFNFIPEGEYRVPESLRAWLVDHGFEVGVHDLHHDGKLYHSRSGFASKAQRINRYLRDWNASGFRSGFMLRELAWLHDLDIEYECSTFDTDPFEPQPTGAHTIFPYWIPCPVDGNQPENRRGYVELPYTLPQDSTLFLLLREPDATIWLRKTDWIARKGGMALVNVHPDYIDWNGSGSSVTYPLDHYETLLRWIKKQHQQQMWHALPRDLSRFVRNHLATPSREPSEIRTLPTPRSPSTIKIWIDLENTPHIPFFRPIIRQLRQDGHHVVITARDAYQTCQMAGFHAFDYQKIGRHYGRHLTAKIWGLLCRSSQLLRFALREKPDLALNLGSRTQNLAAKLTRIPAVEIMDYEHTAESRLLESRWCLAPQAVCTAIHDGQPSARMLPYDGIKEDAYVPDFRPDDRILDQLGLRHAGVVITARPPATEAHYHNPQADTLFSRFMERALERADVRIVLLPRNSRQEAALRNGAPRWFSDPRVIVPDQVVDGLNLIWHSDLVVSGGGTMNREAAALGVPVYSVFRGPTGAVDRLLCQDGRLILIETPADVDQKIQLVPRARRPLPDVRSSKVLTDILGHLREIIQSLHPETASTDPKPGTVEPLSTLKPLV